MTLRPRGRHLLENAAGFAAGARTAASQHRDFRGIMLQHVGIAIELSLKSFLQDRGWSDERCRLELRHDLVKALSATKKLGFRPSDPGLARVVAVLTPIYRRHATAETAAQAPELERILQATERLLDDIAPLRLLVEGRAKPIEEEG